MGYAEVAVNSPVAQRRTFSYSIPPSISLSVGQAVWVPFGPKVLQGVVCRLSEHPEVEETRDIVGVIDPRPLLSSTQIELACWISEYYLAPLFDAVALMLPPGFERKLITFYQLSSRFSSSSPSDLTPEQAQLLELLIREGKVEQAAVEKVLGQKKARRMLDELLGKGLVMKSQELEKVRVRAKLVTHLRLAVKAEVAKMEAECLASRAPKQAALLQLLADRTEPVPVRETGATPAAVKALRDKGLISTVDVHVWRDPLLDRTFAPCTPPILTASQEAALEHIRAGMRQP
jgi:primosomal protein N' (replication factor Y)